MMLRSMDIPCLVRREVLKEMSKHERGDYLLLFVVPFDLILKLILKLVKKRHLNGMELAHFCNIAQWVIMSLKGPRLRQLQCRNWGGMGNFGNESSLEFGDFSPLEMTEMKINELPFAYLWTAKLVGKGFDISVIGFECLIVR